MTQNFNTSPSVSLDPLNIESLIKQTIRECMQDEEFFKANLMKAIADEEVRRATLSYIEEHEVEEAHKVIEEQLGFKFKPPCGFQVLVKLYIRDEIASCILDAEGNRILDENGQPKRIYIPDSVRNEDKFRNAVGLVMALGPEAYKGSRFKGYYCRPGDWVTMAKYELSSMGYKGIPVALIPDDRILWTIEDPSDITPLTEANKY